MALKFRQRNITAILLALVIIVTCVPASAIKTSAASGKWYDGVVASFESKGFYDGEADPKSDIPIDEFIRLAVLSATYNHAEDAVSIALAKDWIYEEELESFEAGLPRSAAAKIAMRILYGDAGESLDDAVKAGIIVGDGKGNLRESDNITYAEAMQLLTNLKEIQNAAIDDTPVKKITVEEFFTNPSAAGYTMSEDGEYLYFMGDYESRINIFRQKVSGIEDGSSEPERLTTITDKNLAGCFIKGDYIVYLADNGGDENYHLFSVKIGDNKSEKDITPYKGVRAMPIDTLENVDNEVLIMMNQKNPEIFDVYKLNVATGDLTLIAENPGDVAGWLTDWDGNVRIAYVSDSIDTAVMYRENDESEFTLLCYATNADTLEPLAFSKDGKLLYMLSNVDRNTTALISMNLETGEETVVYANDDYDIAGATLNEDGSKVRSVSYYDDKMSVLIFDEELETLYNSIKEKFGSEHFSLELNDDKTKAMVTTFSDINPSEYYYYDLESDKVLPLGAAMPWLDSNDLCEMIPVSYTARDGLVIHGYLTLPKNTVSENLPVVVNPHGGPWSRDLWGYNPEVQLLANQGYAVLQMNFRGSTGYGKDFVYAGDKQWGRAMQDDITDGVEWLIDIGVADADRVAIYGASYGGYAALAGITLTPDLYAAAVDYVGVSNLITFMESMPPYWESMRQYLYDRVGDPEEDYDDLVAYSPVNLADKIVTPLFVAQGANDPRVNKAESDQIVEALRARGIDVDYMVKDNEGHGFMYTENQYEFYNAMIEFLAKYLSE